MQCNIYVCFVVVFCCCCCFLLLLFVCLGFFGVCFGPGFCFVGVYFYFLFLLLFFFNLDLSLAQSRASNLKRGHPEGQNLWPVIFASSTAIPRAISRTDLPPLLSELQSKGISFNSTRLARVWLKCRALPACITY